MFDNRNFINDDFRKIIPYNDFLQSLQEIKPNQINYHIDCIINDNISFFQITLNKNSFINKTIQPYCETKEIKKLCFVSAINIWISHIKTDSDGLNDLEVMFITEWKNVDMYNMPLSDLLKYCPAIDKEKVSEMIDKNTNIQKYKYKNSKTAVIEEGIGDWFAKAKDSWNTAKLDSDYKEVQNAKQKEQNKLKNDTIITMIDNIDNALEQYGRSWTNLYKVLRKMGLKNDSILKSFILLFDENGKAPGYKVISTLSKNLANQANNVNLEDDSENNNVKENMENKLKDTLDYIQNHYDFSDNAIYRILGSLNSSDFAKKENNPEKLVAIAFKKAGLSNDTIQKYKKEENDLDAQLNRELNAKEQQNQNKQTEQNTNSVQDKLKDLVSALRNQGYTQKQALALCKSLNPKDIKNKSIEDLYLMAMKSQGQNIFKNSK